tara:strand:+ start:2446 stop:3321 length:876 start_codon:yes stop_codon:yes gene_type:complete
MSINVYEILEKYNLELIGEVSNPKISGPSSLDNQRKDGLYWIKNQKHVQFINKGFFIVNKNSKILKPNNVVLLVTTESPKLIYSKILKEFFTPSISFYLRNDVEKHRQNSQIIISSNVFIGLNVVIGSGTVLYPNTVIEANTVIGEKCIIKSHVSLGTEGLGLEWDSNLDNLVKFPQIGNVVLEDNITIGPNSTVRRGSLSSTIIKSGSHIGSLVNIGHNCKIDSNCILSCNIVTGGSSQVGKNSFLGMGTIIKNGVLIGDNCQIGMGSIVNKDIPSNSTAFGQPAVVKTS